MIKEGSRARVIKQINGMVIVFKVGDEVAVIKIYGRLCTIERPDGKACTVGVPVNHLEPINQEGNEIA